MLIVEGTDLTGKTTLCKKLQKMLNARGEGHIYRHFTRLPDTFQFPVDYLTHAHRLTVQDRFHMSEIAYSYARGQEASPLDPELYRYVDGYLRLLPSLTVVLTAHPMVLRHRFEAEKRAEMYDLDTIVKANQAFLQMGADGFTYGRNHYVVDRDVIFHANEDDQWPDDDFAEHVISKYMSRQLRVWVTVHNTRDTYARPSCWPT